MLTWLIDMDGDWVLTIVRVVLGVVLFAHGAQKLLGWFGGQGFSVTVRTFRDQLGIPAPLACLAIAAEFFCGLGLILVERNERVSSRSPLHFPSELTERKRVQT